MADANYILLDAARLQDEIHSAKELNAEHTSLYKGRTEEIWTDLGPYLFTIPREEVFINWYKESGWGDAWGILMQSSGSFDEVYNHFRNFLLVKTENGDELYFRFYDPRVLKLFLPSCDKEQILGFFGPVESFIVEDGTKETAIKYTHQQGILKQRIIPAATIFTSFAVQG